MPDAQGFPTPEEIANGGSTPAQSHTQPIDLDKLSEDQQKAMIHILSGHPFIFIGAAPTKRFGEEKSDAASATGASIYSAAHGDRDTLLGIKPALPRLIDKLYARKGLF